MPDSTAPWTSPTNWKNLGRGDFPTAPPTPTSGKLSYDDWYNQIGKNQAYSISFGSPAASYLDYIGQSGQTQTQQTPSPTPTATQGSTGQQSPLSPSPFPTQQQSTGTPSVSSTNPYMSLPSYGTSTGMYPQAFANSGTQNQADASGGTGNYSPTNYNKLPTYGFYY